MWNVLTREVEVVRKMFGTFIPCKLYFCRSNTFYIFFSFFFFLPSFVVQWGKNIFGRKLDVVTEKRSVSCSLYIK